MAGYFTAPRIAWGPGAVEQLSGLGLERALVVVDPNVARRDGGRRVVEELQKSGTAVELVTDSAHPDRTDDVRSLGDRLVASGVDGLIAIGGGRTIDGAKAARRLASRPGLSAEALAPLLDGGPPSRIRLVAVPTTSGSGSEASGSADLLTPEGDPLEIAHREMVPDWALVDPAFAEGLSPGLLVDGALETLAQSVEAYLSAWSNPYSDALATDAARTIVQRSPHAIRWSDDPDARAALHYAATAAGLAASNAQRGLAHALARALVPTTGLSYARLAGVLLPFVLEFDQPSARDRLEALGLAVSVPDDSGRLTSPPWPLRLRRLYDLLRFPLDLRSAGASGDAIERDRARIVARTLRSPAALANPRVPSAHEVDGLLSAALGPPGPRAPA